MLIQPLAGRMIRNKMHNYSKQRIGKIVKEENLGLMKSLLFMILEADCQL